MKTPHSYARTRALTHTHTHAHKTITLTAFLRQRPSVFSYTYVACLVWRIASIHIINRRGNMSITQSWGAFGKSLLPLESNKYCIFRMCVYSLSYPARKAHALHYIVICVSVWLHYIFRYCLIYGAIFGKKAFNHNIYVSISATILSEILSF
jgi:hypothetical protein